MRPAASDCDWAHTTEVVHSGRESARARQAALRGIPVGICGIASYFSARPQKRSRRNIRVFVQLRSAQDETSEFSYNLDDASLAFDRACAVFRGVRHEYALDSLLRILLSFVLLPRRGFLLHAASVVRDGRAYVFVGRSGAGKSTVASLSPPGSVLTDEISLLRFSDGHWHAHGTPFWGEFRAAGMNQRYPVAGIYLLSQDQKDRIEPLSTKDIVKALLPCVLFFTSRKAAHEVLFQMLLYLAKQIPCYRLSFRLGSGFWEVIAP